MTEPGMDLAVAVLSAASAMTDAVDATVRARGFDGIRAAHGFAFARLAPDGATVSALAEHLGVTKQAASQMVDELVRGGYVSSSPHPDDARARLIPLTERGWACTRAAEAAAAEVAAAWSAVLGGDAVRRLRDDLSRVGSPGRLRPAW